MALWPRGLRKTLPSTGFIWRRAFGQKHAALKAGDTTPDDLQSWQTLRLRSAGDPVDCLAQINALSKRLRAKFIVTGHPVEPSSQELGAMEILASLMARAAASQNADAQRNVFRRRHIAELLEFLAADPLTEKIPTQIGAALKIELPNVSRLLEPLRTTGLIERLKVSKTRDARVSPVRITAMGVRLLDEIKPGWRSRLHAQNASPASGRYAPATQPIVDPNAHDNLSSTSVRVVEVDVATLPVIERVTGPKSHALLHFSN